LHSNNIAPLVRLFSPFSPSSPTYFNNRRILNVQKRKELKKHQMQSSLINSESRTYVLRLRMQRTAGHCIYANRTEISRVAIITLLTCTYICLTKHHISLT